MLKNYRVIKSNQVCSEKYFLETLINQGFQGNMPLSIAGTVPDAGATKPVNQGFKGLGNQK